MLFTKIFRLLFLSILIPCTTLHAQVTIGANLEPLSGAILELKNNNDSTGGVTAFGGLLLPRVALISNSSLEPTVSFEENSDDLIKQEHTGLILYNVGEEIIESDETRLCKGIHVWSGFKWEPLIPYPIWTPGVNLLSCSFVGSAFSIDCNSVKVEGIYQKNIALDSTNYLEVTLNADVGAIGEKYILETYSPINKNIRFRAEGVITSAQQIIKLAGTGTPDSYDPINLSLICNNNNNDKCNLTVEVLYPRMRIVGVGDPNYHPASGSNTSKSYVLMNNPKAFGRNKEAIVKVDNFNFENHTKRNDKEWIELFKSKPDIIIRAYNCAMGDAVGAELKQYLDSGGVFIEFNDNNHCSNAGVRALYGANAKSNITSGDPGQLHPFNNEDAEIINGVWGDLTGKSWAEDASYTQGVSGVPLDQILVHSVTTTHTKAIVAFRDKNVNYIYIGDGGFLSGYGSSTSGCCFPFQLDSNNMPIAGNKGVRYNSVYFANVITWALKQAATNGINKY